MFLEILQTLMKVLMVFSILIIAFGLAFFILMSKVFLQEKYYLFFLKFYINFMYRRPQLEYHQIIYHSPPYRCR